MSLFSSILHNLKQKIDAEHAYKDVVIGCIFSIAHSSIPRDAVLLKNGVLYINTTPTIKMTLLLKKEILLRALQEKQINVVSIK